MFERFNEKLRIIIPSTVEGANARRKYFLTQGFVVTMRFALADIQSNTLMR